MFTSVKSPMILSGDSFIFESAGDKFTDPQEHVSYVDEVVTKHAGVDELSSHLPLFDGSSGEVEDSKTPFAIHSSVLDSVFSNALDDKGEDIDQTPMFDELDFIVDGARANLKEDWVSLFGDESQMMFGETSDPVVKDEDLRHQPEASKRLFAQSMAPSVFIPTKKQKRNTESQQNQLITPETSSTLATPIIDLSDIQELGKSSSPSVDRLGCVPYSKKQRSRPLAPVPIDESDPVALKRARNTVAARRSRARKMERMGQLEEKVDNLMKEKSEMESEMSRLKDLLTQNGIQF